MSQSRGIAFVLATAAVSGVSIFLNRFAVSGLNAFVFTTLKNVLVAVFLLSVIFLLKEFKNLKQLSARQWQQLALIGLVGGSIPFLLFFFALKQTSAMNAGFIHKTLFVWAFVFAAVFLKEKIEKKILAGAALLLAGNFLLFSNFSQFGFADALILIAAVLWAAENVLAKKAFEQTNARIVGFGRMFFGSIFMLAFLAFTGDIALVPQLSPEQFGWVALTGTLLFLYVLFYYSGLKYVKVSTATALLALAQPITAILSIAFSGTAISLNEAIGFVLILIGCFAVIGTGYFLAAAKKIGLIPIKQF